MAEKDIVFETDTVSGEVKISNEVLVTIAAQALNEIKGIQLATSVAEGFVDKLVKKNTSKGVRIYLNDEVKEADLDIHISIEYGINIPEVSWHIQDAVKKNVETMTDVKVNKVNVFVDGVTVEKEPKVPLIKRVKQEVSEPAEKSDETKSEETKK